MPYITQREEMGTSAEEGMLRSETMTAFAMLYSEPQLAVLSGCSPGTQLKKLITAYQETKFIGYDTINFASRNFNNRIVFNLREIKRDDFIAANPSAYRNSLFIHTIKDCSTVGENARSLILLAMAIEAGFTHCIIDIVSNTESLRLPVGSQIICNAFASDRNRRAQVVWRKVPGIDARQSLDKASIIISSVQFEEFMNSWNDKSIRLGNNYVADAVISSTFFKYDYLKMHSDWIIDANAICLYSLSNINNPYLPDKSWLRTHNTLIFNLPMIRNPDKRRNKLKEIVWDEGGHMDHVYDPTLLQIWLIDNYYESEGELYLSISPDSKNYMTADSYGFATYVLGRDSRRKRIQPTTIDICISEKDTWIYAWPVSDVRDLLSWRGVQTYAIKQNSVWLKQRLGVTETELHSVRPAVLNTVLKFYGLRPRSSPNNDTSAWYKGKVYHFDLAGHMCNMLLAADKGMDLVTWLKVIYMNAMGGQYSTIINEMFSNGDLHELFPKSYNRRWHSFIEWYGGILLYICYCRVLRIPINYPAVRIARAALQEMLDKCGDRFFV